MRAAVCDETIQSEARLSMNRSAIRGQMGLLDRICVPQTPQAEESPDWRTPVAPYVPTARRPDCRRATSAGAVVFTPTPPLFRAGLPRGPLRTPWTINLYSALYLEWMDEPPTEGQKCWPIRQISGPSWPQKTRMIGLTRDRILQQQPTTIRPSAKSLRINSWGRLSRNSTCPG